MSQSDKPKNATGRRGAKKPQPQDLESQIAEMIRARDAAQQQAIEAHSAFQNLSRRAGELESHLGELDSEAKGAREEAARAKAHAFELERRILELSADASRVADLEETLRQHRDQLERITSLRDQALKDLEASRAKAEELRKELAPLRSEGPGQEEHARGLELEVHKLRMQAAVRDGELRRAREETDRAKARINEMERRGRELESQVALLAAAERESEAQLRRGEQAASAARAIGLELEECRRRLEEQRDDLGRLKNDLAGAQEGRTAAEAEASRLRGQMSDMSLKLEAADARASQISRYFESMERELIQAREAEANARTEAARGEELKGTVKRLDAEVQRLEEIRREQLGWLDELGQSVVDLERRLEEASIGRSEITPPSESPRPESGPPGTSPGVIPAPPAAEAAPAPVAPSSPADPSPPPAIVEGPARPAEPAPIASTAASLPPAAPLPGPAREAETTLRPQHLFGPMAKDGQPAYVLLEVLARDALGGVYRAQERLSGSLFSVRFIGGQAGEDQTRAIEREVEKLISLPHPNLLHVRSSGRRKNRVYLVTDPMDAPSLARSGLQEIPRITSIFRDVAAAVQYAHVEGIFHGDLTPENILVGREGEKDHPLVKDFALGYIMESVATVSPDGEMPSFIRNPAYLPPEQVRVLRSPLGAAVDIYGLGATLYAALSGRPPFEGKDPAHVAKRVMIEEPVPVERLRPDVPKGIAALVRRAMAKERGLRFGSMQELVDALARLLEARAA